MISMTPESSTSGQQYPFFTAVSASEQSASISATAPAAACTRVTASATCRRMRLKISYSSSLSRSDAERMSCSRSLSSCVMKRSQFTSVCLRT